MAVYRHPGVYIEEISQPGPIQGVTTSTLGFVGIAERGVDPSGLNPGLYNEPTMITGWKQFSDTFGGIVWNRFLAPAVYTFFKKGGTLAYIVRVNEGAAAAVGVADLSPFGSLNATSSGSWSSNIQIEIINSPASAPSSTTTPAFTLNVIYTLPLDTNIDFDNFIKVNNIPNTGDSTTPKYVLESFGGITVPIFDDSATPTQEEIDAAMLPTMNRIESQSLFIRLVPPTAAPVRPDNSDGSPITFSGGADGSPNYGTSADDMDGLYSFGKLQDDTINIMAIPDIVTYGITTKGLADTEAQKKQAGVINNAVAYCEDKMTMFFIGDPPLGLTLTGIQEYKQGVKTNIPLTSNYGSIYYPWITMNNPGTMTNLSIPPSGPTAGVYADTDTKVGVYKAPAGINDGSLASIALDLERNITDTDQDVLNPYGINAIRNLPSYGTVVWGARTLAVDTEWTYINVRRLFIFLESSIKRASWWVVFEPNSPKLWGTVNRNITAFLNQQWQEGALYGSTADEAFFVKIDEDNNPRELQKLGQLHIDIGVAPVFPAEFVIISFQQKTLPTE